MTKLLLFITIFFASVFTASASFAHPGARILTAGASQEQTAMTQGMTFEEVGAVHVFRGRKAIARTKPAAVNPLTRTTIIKINIKNNAFRSFRRLRTQGFYSGNGPKSRRYTQGFYSGD